MTAWWASLGFWPYVVAALVAVIVAGEIIAKKTGGPTLSRAVWRTQARFPTYAFLAGGVVGWLACHLLGWNPACNP